MANQLNLSSSGNARVFINSLDSESRALLEEAFRYIVEMPFEHGDTITRRMMPPVMLDTYHDEYWEIVYTLDKLSGQLDFNINVVAIRYS